MRWQSVAAGFRVLVSGPMDRSGVVLRGLALGSLCWAVYLFCTGQWFTGTVVLALTWLAAVRAETSTLRLLGRSVEREVWERYVTVRDQFPQPLTHDEVARYSGDGHDTAEAASKAWFVAADPTWFALEDELGAKVALDAAIRGGIAVRLPGGRTLPICCQPGLAASCAHQQWPPRVIQIEPVGLLTDENVQYARATEFRILTDVPTQHWFGPNSMDVVVALHAVANMSRKDHEAATRAARRLAGSIHDLERRDEYGARHVAYPMLDEMTRQLTTITGRELEVLAAAEVAEQIRLDKITPLGADPISTFVRRHGAPRNIQGRAETILLRGLVVSDTITRDALTLLSRPLPTVASALGL